MALVKCEDCGHDISPSASMCPSCGRPQRPVCPRCGARAVVTGKGFRGVERFFGLVLASMALLPGIAYYMWRTRLPYCTSCRRRVAKSALGG